MTKSELKISDNEVMLERYFHKDDPDTLDILGTSAVENNEEDRIHPNEKGYNIYGREFERALFFGTLLS